MLLFKHHIDRKQIGHLLKVQYKSPSVSTYYFVNSLGAKTHGDDPISYKSNTMWVYLGKWATRYSHLSTVHYPHDL